MRENLITLDRALNAANKAGAFTLQEAIAIINAFQEVIKFAGEHFDLSEPVEEKPKKATAKQAATKA